MSNVAQHPFDSPVKAGEIRIFGESKNALTALVAEDKGLAGFRIVPISERAKPFSSREMLVGERVYQLWNTVVAPKDFVEKSWIVETLAKEDFAEVVASIDAALPGKLTADDSDQAKYERENLINVDALMPKLAEPAKPRNRKLLFRYSAMSIAAMFVIFAGLSWMVYNEGVNERSLQVADTAKNLAAVEKAAMGPQHEYDECLSAPDDEFFSSDAGEPSEAMPDLSLDVPPSPVVDAPAMAMVSAKPAQPVSRRELCCEKETRASVETIMSPVTMRSMCASRSRRGVEQDFFVRGADEPQVQHECEERRYANKDENPFTDPRVTPLSTFGLDVDTTSYSLMRGWIQDRHRLPPASSVRIEEYVNSFKYDYAEPTGDDPIAIAAECGVCPWNKEHKLLRIGLRAKDLTKDMELPPCNLTFLIDTSGSMSGDNRLGLAKVGLKFLVGKLCVEDHVAIVTYSGDTSVRLPSVCGSEKAKIESVIDSLRACGCTAGGAGIELAYAEAQKNFAKDANNRVILITDGDFNVGARGPDELEKLIEQKRSSGIFLSVFGVGHGNFQDAAMKKLANAGNGNYAYLDSVLEAKKVFSDAFASSLYTVAKDVKLQLEFNPAEVAQYRLLGYENRALAARDFNDDKKDAGEMGSGHTMTALYEIVPFGAKEEGVDPLKYQKNEKPVRAEGASDELCTVKLRWKAPDQDESVRRDLPLKAAAITPKNPSEDFRFASAVAEFALVLKHSKYKGDASLSKVLERAKNAKGEDADGSRAEFIKLVECGIIWQNEN